jgi:hypothetical protein
MKNLVLATGLLLSLESMAKVPLIVHEWGTFTSLMGSTGKVYDGMFHEDEELPDFVHRFGENVVSFSKPQLVADVSTSRCLPPNRCKVGVEFLRGQEITQKMETPVLYFYSDKAVDLTVSVDFPEGIIAEAYPKWTSISPEEIPGVELTKGNAKFNIEIQAPGKTHLNLPEVKADNIYAHARHTKSNLLKSGNEVEKFIFYRGLGRFNTDLSVTSSLKDGGLHIKNKSENKISAVYLFNIDAQGGSFKSLGSLTHDKEIRVTPKDLLALTTQHLPFANFTQLAEKMLLEDLTANGLYQDEAVAMMNTWKQGYFKTPGLRVLYVLNREEVERILPMKLHSGSSMRKLDYDMTRVFIGRIEVLTVSQEVKLLQKILAAGENFEVGSLGRFADSLLLRIKEVMIEKELDSESNLNLIAKLRSQL